MFVRPTQVSPHIRILKVKATRFLSENMQRKVVGVYHLPTAIHLPLRPCGKIYGLVVSPHLSDVSAEGPVKARIRTDFLAELIIMDMALVGSTPSFNCA